MVEDKNSKLAREHYEKAEDYTKQAGQHTASAASTVGHDLRAAGEQLAEASKNLGSSVSSRMTEGSRNVGDRAQDTLDKAGEHARSTADDAADSTKSTYNKIKSSIGSFLGGAKHPDDKPVHDAAHRAADTVNKGVDKAHEGQRKVYERTPTPGDVQEQGREALESAKETAVHTKDAVVGGLSYIGGRLTAPVSGDEGTDRELADKAKAKTRSAADAVSSGARSAQDKAGQAADEAKHQSKGLFSSIRDAFSQPADRDSAAERAHHDTATLSDKAKSAIGDAQDKVKGSVEEAKKQLIEAAEAAQPKTEAEAILSQGGIPSNTADLLKARESSATMDRAAHERAQGTHMSVESVLAKTAEAWGGDNLTGDGGLSSVRDAADHAGPHSRMS